MHVQISPGGANYWMRDALVARHFNAGIGNASIGIGMLLACLHVRNIHNGRVEPMSKDHGPWTMDRGWTPILI